MATHGATPTRTPNQNGTIVVRLRSGGFITSCNHPNRIMATLAPMMPRTAEISVIPA